jgi:hypothetical protein
MPCPEGKQSHFFRPLTSVMKSLEVCVRTQIRVLGKMSHHRALPVYRSGPQKSPYPSLSPLFARVPKGQKPRTFLSLAPKKWEKPPGVEDALGLTLLASSWIIQQGTMCLQVLLSSRELSPGRTSPALQGRQDLLE